MKEKGKLVELAVRRREILEKLRLEKCYVGKLAKDLKKKPPQVSKNLNELEVNGLLRWEQGEGRRKYYSMTDVAKRILGALDEATQSIPEEKLKNWKINEFVDILEDQNLSESLRLHYSNMLYHICSEHPEVVIANERIRELLWKTLVEPASDKVGQDLMRSLSAILPCAMNDEKWKGRVQQIYPDLLRNAADSQASEAARLAAISKLAQIARLSQESSLKEQAEKTLLDIWFSEDTDKGGNIGENVRRELESFGSRRLFDHVRNKAKDPKLKDKAETLLAALSTYLLPT